MANACSLSGCRHVGTAKKRRSSPRRLLRPTVRHMPLDRRPAPGRALTWVGAANDLAVPGDVGVFVDFDGGLDSYVVDFGPGRTFCCHPDEVVVVVVATPPSHEERRHRSKG